jgi:hypothetical protein
MTKVKLLSTNTSRLEKWPADQVSGIGINRPDLQEHEGNKISWFRYVVHSRIDEYKASGWKVASELGPPHGFYAVLMELVNER